MRKADLKVGEIYADKWGYAFLLLNANIWARWRRGAALSLCSARQKTPERGKSFLDSDRGVLVLRGETTDLREWARDHMDTVLGWSVVPNDTGATDQQAIKDWLYQSLMPESYDSLRLTVADYRQWKGSMEDVERALREEEEQADADKQRLDNLRTRRRNRADAIRAELSARYNITHASLSETPVRRGNQKQHVITGVHLGLSDIEKILGIDNEEK